MARLTPSQQRELLRSANRAMRGRRGAGGIFRRLGAKLGAAGELVGILADILTGGRGGPSRQTIQDAIEILQGQGFEIGPSGARPPVAPGEPIAPPVVRPPATPSGPVKPAARPKRARPAEVWPQEHTVETIPTRVLGRYETVPKGVEGFSPWLFCPESSNVFAFMYDYENGQLYVQFRAEGKPTSYKEIVNSCSGEKYQVGVRPNSPGAVYSYGSASRPVPESVFNAFVQARSKGKAVWDLLRECGSAWQHKFSYSLVTSTPGSDYVSRRATRRGLRVRTVPTVGSGRRSFRRSTLPERIR